MRLGSWPGAVMASVSPLRAWRTVSNAGSAASGPPGPKPVTKQRTSRGLVAASTSSVRPSDSAMPERQFGEEHVGVGEELEERVATRPGP